MSNGTTVQVAEIEGGRCELRAPFHANCAPNAKALGGRWDSLKRRWVFDARNIERVRALAVALWGTDGSPVETCTLQVAIEDEDRWAAGTNLVVLGRTVARAFSRDGDASFQPDCSLVRGDVTSGGSRKNPRIVVERGTVVELRDVPVSLVKRALERGDWGIEGARLAGAWVVAPVEKPEIDRAALEAERARLVARLAEIDAKLGA